MSRPRSLTDAQAIEIKIHLKDSKISNKWICETYGISRQVLCHIKNGRSYKDLDQFVK